MKKTIFLLTLLLPIGLLFAQQSEVLQYGNDNSVVVTQEGEANYSWVYTIGDDNAPSFVDQEGDGVNNSYVDQDDGFDVFFNTANVTQINLSSLVSDENMSDINQTGDYNSAEVTQNNTNELVNDYNYSLIQQDGSYNTATVTQTDIPSTFGPKARDSYIDQSGDDNTATVTQIGKREYAKIDQSGFENTGLVDQDGIILNAEIFQTGLGNTGEVMQEGRKENALINQHGIGGTAGIYQGKGIYTIPGTGSGYNDAEILQTLNVSGGLAEQHQDGRQNDAFIDQDAGGVSKAIQIQVNTLGYYVGPHGTDVNDADIEQTAGFDNEAYQLQHYSVEGNPNIANVYQEGSENYSSEMQYGGANESVVTQIGNGNFSDVTQNVPTVPLPSYVIPLPW